MSCVVDFHCIRMSFLLRSKKLLKFCFACDFEGLSGKQVLRF